MKFFPELDGCRICPHECGINRYQAVGFCRAGAEIKVNLAQLHFGEEPVFSGSRGSGTIFFSHCNLRCVFCQNYKISHLGWGEPVSGKGLADMMLGLQSQGAHNINLVSPTQYTPQIRSALILAKETGLHIPVIWNSNAYEKSSTLASLAGLVDIWLPDFKYAHPYYAERYSGARNYPEQALMAIEEMFKQAGFLHTDEDGIAKLGVAVRHLVLPNMLSGSCDVLRLLYDRFGPELPLSLMAQYYPAGKANDYPELDRGIGPGEYEKVLDCAKDLGFHNVMVQELSSDDTWTPRFRNSTSR
jgi:putative pyruvate formate lyase activating enzyme